MCGAAASTVLMDTAYAPPPSYYSPQSAGVHLSVLGSLPYYPVPPAPKPRLVLASGALSWDKRNFIYTDGSPVAGKPMMGAEAVRPARTKQSSSK